MARFPRTIGDVLSAQSTMRRDLGTAALGTPELALLTADNIAGESLTKELLTPEVQQEITDSTTKLVELDTQLGRIDAAVAKPVTWEKFDPASLTVWPFVHTVIPPDSFEEGAISGNDIKDFAVTVNKLK